MFIVSNELKYYECFDVFYFMLQKGLNVNAIPKLPKVKKLMLVMGAEEDDSLLEYTSIAQACPTLETFSISVPLSNFKKLKTL